MVVTCRIDCCHAASGFFHMRENIFLEDTMAKDKQKIGVTGEFLALAKLSALGFTVAPTLKNAPHIDILVSDGLSAKMVQVKTTANKKNDWICGLPEKSNKKLVYIFVKLDPKTAENPMFYIVPSADVKTIMTKIDKEFNKRYLEIHGIPFNAEGNKKGVSKFNDSYESIEKYKDNWQELNEK
jgi:hypothetical protein